MLTATSTMEQSRGFSVERGVTAFAGFMVLLSVALTYWVHPGFIWLTVFVGANLFQQSFTGFCPAAFVMRRLGLRSEAELEQARQGRGGA
jgi:hypothetical protein